MPILFLSNWFTIIVFLKSICREKNYMAILLYFSTEYLLSVKHRKLNFTKKTSKLLARFLYSSYTVCTIRYISYICDFPLLCIKKVDPRSHGNIMTTPEMSTNRLMWTQKQLKSVTYSIDLPLVSHVRSTGGFEFLIKDKTRC